MAAINGDAISCEVAKGLMPTGAILLTAQVLLQKISGTRITTTLEKGTTYQEKGILPTRTTRTCCVRRLNPGPHSWLTNPDPSYIVLPFYFL